MHSVPEQIEAIDWPALFAATADLKATPHEAWAEVRPGIWQAPFGATDMIAVAAVCPTGPTWVASVLPVGLQPAHLAQMGFTLHDAIAERLRAAGWTVGCAGPECAYTWPCPKREMHDFMGAPNGGELHTPVGIEKAAK